MRCCKCSSHLVSLRPLQGGSESKDPLKSIGILYVKGSEPHLALQKENSTISGKFFFQNASYPRIKKGNFTLKSI